MEKIVIQRHQSRVIEPPKQIKAKYGYCSMLKLQLLSTNEEIVIFGKENDGNILGRCKDEVVEIYQDDKQKWKLLATTVTSKGKTSSHPQQSVTLETSDNVIKDLLDDEDLPVFSDSDKRRIMKYIKSQAKLLKYCHDSVCEVFPEIMSNDPRGARSLAVTLLISTNQRIGRSV